MLAVLLVTYCAIRQPKRARVSLRNHPRAAAAASWSPTQADALRSVVRRSLQLGVAHVRRVSAVVLAADGRVLYSQSARQALTPASSIKVLIALAALHVLGPQMRFDTRFAAAELPDSSGRLGVPLWLIGSGDPTLRYKDLLDGIRAVRTGGVRAVSRVMVDAHAIAGPELNPFWNQSDANEDYQVATSGISLDEDTVEFHFQGTSPGTPARVFVEPPSSAVRWSGSVATSASGDGIDVETGAPNTFAVSGYLGAGGRRTKYLPVHSLPRYVGAVTERMLRDRGVKVEGPTGTGVAPRGLRVYWDRRSPPLRTIVRHMLVHSDNHFAEQLLRYLGRCDGGAATDAAGIDAELRFLRNARIPTEGVRLHDASGLAHADQISALTLALLLQYAQSAGDQLYPLLPRGGMDGTLRSYHFQDSRGRVRAKSGHLDDVDALVGYVDTRKHGRLTFAFLVQGTRYIDDAVVAALDRLATL